VAAASLGVLELGYPDVTPEGDAVERDDEPFRHHERIHLSSPDRRTLYLEVVRFRGLTPEDEYREHRPHLERRFGPDGVTGLVETELCGRPAWTYSFRGDAIERAAILLEAGGDTYRVIYDPRSELNTQALATITITSS
jgi:hypothetical protein